MVGRNDFLCDFLVMCPLNLSCNLRLNLNHLKNTFFFFFLQLQSSYDQHIGTYHLTFFFSLVENGNSTKKTKVVQSLGYTTPQMSASN